MSLSPSKPQPKATFTLFVGWQGVADLVGSPIDQLLEKASLPAAYAAEEHVQLTTHEMLRLWRALEHEAGEWELVRLLLGAFDQQLPAPYLAALCCRNLRSGIERFAECKPLIGPMRFRLEPHAAGAALHFDWAIPPEELPATITMFEFAMLLLMARRGTGRKVVPVVVECPDAAAIPHGLARELLGLPVTTGAAMQIVFSSSDLEEPFQTSNPSTLGILDAFFQERLKAVSPTAVEQVRMALQRLLPAGRASIADVAESLCVSVRSLQRSLLREGTSFKDLLADTRCQLARRYLGAARFSPKETTFLLGYSEVATFSRAFRQWTGTTPAAFAADASRNASTRKRVMADP